MQFPLLSFGSIAIEIIFGDFPFGRKPNIGKTPGVTDTFLKNADDVRASADMRVDETIDQLGRAGLAFAVQTIEGRLEAVEITAARDFCV